MSITIFKATRVVAAAVAFLATVSLDTDRAAYGPQLSSSIKIEVVAAGSVAAAPAAPAEPAKPATK